MRGMRAPVAIRNWFPCQIGIPYTNPTLRGSPIQERRDRGEGLSLGLTLKTYMYPDPMVEGTHLCPLVVQYDGIERDGRKRQVRLESAHSFIHM